MQKLILIVALVVGLADTALAETWLCIEEASAGVTMTAPFISSEVAVKSQKYIATVQEDTNRVELKPFGQNAWTLDCTNNSHSIFCESQGSGFEFNINKKEARYWRFSILKSTDDGKMWLTVESGKCSTI